MSSGTLVTLPELARTFLKLGLISFGGPAAHLAIMEEELVSRKKWLSRERFLDLMGAVNLIPGPNSTEVAIHIGYQTCGFAGLFAAGICFILPSALIVAGIAALYMRFGKLPGVIEVLNGIKPVMIAVILQALFTLSLSAFKSHFLAALALISAALVYFGVNEIAVLFLGALISLAAQNSGGKKFYAVAPLAGTATASALSAIGLWPLFFIFLKIGAMMFGSGYVLLAFLRGDFVERLGWLTDAQLLDGIAVGQVTPGPLFTTATFIGYVLMGLPGAAVATIGIFLPAFFFVAISGPLIPRLRNSRRAAAFLDGLNAASLGLMAFVTLQLGRHALADAYGISLFFVAVFLLWRFRAPTVGLVLGGMLAGFLRFLLSY